MLCEDLHGRFLAFEGAVLVEELCLINVNCIIYRSLTMGLSVSAIDNCFSLTFNVVFNLLEGPAKHLGAVLIGVGLFSRIWNIFCFVRYISTGLFPSLETAHKDAHFGVSECSQNKGSSVHHLAYRIVIEDNGLSNADS